MNHDNIIDGLFTKIFTSFVAKDAQQLFLSTALSTLKSDFFHNDAIISTIANLTRRSVNTVRPYLKSDYFIDYFLFEILKNQHHVDTIMHRQFYPDEIVCCQLAVVNHHEDYISQITIDRKLHGQLLYDASILPTDEIYHKLSANGLVPNISVLTKALSGQIQHQSIIKSITNRISISRQTIKLAFESNNTEIILYLLEISANNSIKIDSELIKYPVLNSNHELIDILLKKYSDKFKITDQTYLSALLSGSIDTIKLIESYLPDIHREHVLDQIKVSSKSAPLIHDMTYYNSDVKYYANVMNHAIQSNKIDVVKYVYNLSYGISTSNFITALHHETSILEFLCQNHTQILPWYIIVYFGMYSYISDKYIRAQMLYDYGLLHIDLTQKHEIFEYNSLDAHVKLLTQSSQIIDYTITDVDFLCNYKMYFGVKSGFKFDHARVSSIILCIKLNIVDQLEIIYANPTILENNLLLLYGSLSQLKKYANLSVGFHTSILTELVCYCCIEKICFCLGHNLIQDRSAISTLIYMLNDDTLSLLQSKLPQIIPSWSQILHRNCVTDTISYVKSITANWQMYSGVITSRNIDVLKSFNHNNALLNRAISLSIEMGLDQIANYLINVKTLASVSS